MNLDTRLSAPPHVLSRLVGDETVLLDLVSGEYFGLDRVGKAVWESLSAGHNLDEVVAVVTAEFSVTRREAEADVLEFADTLLQRGLLVREPGE